MSTPGTAVRRGRMRLGADAEPRRVSGCRHLAALGVVLAIGFPCSGRAEQTPSSPSAPPNLDLRPDRRAIVERALADFDEGVALSDSAPDRAAEKLRAAVQGFESVARSGAAGGALYYNLGNAYLRLGKLGMAIANYRRAEELIPGDGNLEANLTFALQQRRNKIEAGGGQSVLRTLFFWHYRLPFRRRFLIGLVLYVVFWAVMTLRPYLRQVGLRLAAGLLAVGWITFGLSAAATWAFESLQQAGVIVADEVMVRKGNGENYEPQVKQPLYEGVEFQLREHRGEWLKVELADGNAGWIRADQAELLTPAIGR